MKARLPASAYINWQLYWQQEPWGPWRDNLHTAILAREVRRPHLKENAKDELDTFMVMSPAERHARHAERQRQSAAAFMQLFKTISKRKKRT